LDALSELEAKNLSNLLKSRLSRVVDPKTGQIYYEMVRGGSEFIDEGQDPELVDIAADHLPILRNKIRAMQGSDCCSGDLTTQLGAADIAIGALDEELRDTPCKVVIDRILNMLDAHIQKIGRLTGTDGSPDLIEKANKAAKAFTSLQTDIKRRTSQLGRVLSRYTLDWWNYVVTRPMTLSHEAAELQRMLLALGVTWEQLNGQEVALNVVNAHQPPPTHNWTMWEFLQAAQDFPKLWIKEASAKRDKTTGGRIADAAKELHDVFDAPLDSSSSHHTKSIEEICDGLGLLTDECCDDGREIMARLKRFAKLGVTILGPVAMVPPPPAAGGPAVVGSP
jgi:hypothetical protein